MALTDEQKKEAKERRLLIYDSRIFEQQMDLAAARAVGDDTAAAEIEKEIQNLLLAREAIEKM
jgi:hypothetical protein